MMDHPTTTMWRPVGPEELELIRGSGVFPPRLPDQPIFYPVTNRGYACRIAREWNVPASGSGYVTEFEVDARALERWPEQLAGGRDCSELWVPAEELPEFSALLVGPIRVVEAYGTGVILLDGAKMTTKSELMREFARGLAFPGYFGANWDALSECLADLDWLLRPERWDLHVTCSTQVLAAAAPADRMIFQQVLQSVAASWAEAIELDEPWDRPAIPFHVHLHEA